MLPQAVERFIQVYQQLNKHNFQLLADIYSDDIFFQDALHTVEGLSALNAYFENLYTNLSYCHFDIQKTLVQDAEAFVTWQMKFSHPRLHKGQAICVDGVTHLKFNEKIYYHRDYADMGQMLYEHIPVLGNVIQYIKRRASA